MNKTKRRRTGRTDVWIDRTVTGLNQTHLKQWRNLSLQTIEADRKKALDHLCRQDAEFLRTPIRSWVHGDCTTTRRYSDGNPIDCDVLIIRPHPCKSSLTSKEGTTHRKGDYAADHLQFMDAFVSAGFTGKRVFSLYYSPYYMTDKSFRGLCTKHAREILGWRMSVALWLIRPKYILGTNTSICKLIASKFDSRQYESFQPIKHGIVYRHTIKSPPMIRNGKNYSVFAMRTDHPFLFSESNAKSNPKSRENFNNVARCLKQWFDQDEDDNKHKEATPMYVKLLQNAIGIAKPEFDVKKEKEEDAQEEEEQLFCPAWLTVDNWNLFYAPQSGVCECDKCGGCGAVKEWEVDWNYSQSRTIYPKKSCYSGKWLQEPSFECNRCQCVHGHRSLDFNECTSGCPEGGFVDSIHSKTHTVCERFDPVRFVDQLLKDPSCF